MRVLMFGWEFPPHISGGLGTACYGMARALREKGVEVTFVLPRASKAAETCDGMRLVQASDTPITPDLERRLNEGSRHMWREDMRVYSINALLFPYDTPTVYARRMRWRALEAGSFRLSAPAPEIEENIVYTLKGGYGPDLMAEVYRFSRMAAIIALRENFDVLHAHDWMTYPAAILARALTGRPLVAHIHATEYDRSGENVNSAVAGIERAGLHAADRVIAVSHLTKKLVMERYGVPEWKIDVVHNAVARHDVVHAYSVPQRLRHEKRVLFLGRVTFQKGPEYFIEAARLVLERMRDVRFYMAGSGDMLSDSIHRVGKLRMGSRFHFTGFLQGTEVDRMFALSDLYVMPSVSEPFGITPLEAMLYDVPVLLSRQSGVSEVLNHALKADFWDIRDMADKICAVLRYPCLAGELVKNCREEMKNIHWGNVAEQLNRIYHAVSIAGGQ